jgi:hypothetical protein
VFRFVQISTAVGREHSFADSEFNRRDYDPYDRGRFEPGLVFVIMPFTEDMTQTYAVLKEECSSLGLTATRVDEGTGSSFVIREVTDLIERSEFLICDLSNERPNVYYEVGYAHGVGNEAADILLIARAGTALHFDIAPLRVHFYRDLDELRAVVS